MILRDRVYAQYRETIDDLRFLYGSGLQRFIESKRYLKIRKRYLEMKATLPNPLLDRRVNKLLKIDFNQEKHDEKSDPKDE